ncbi:hypothetical protein ACJIZ3_023820 [Penstemon smallii]|uniref:Uncharacterized protein n=1 Tax=Penstemon smallii TaxID=265156 RepID=A0ABD3TQ34_9LAMI
MTHINLFLFFILKSWSKSPNSNSIGQQVGYNILSIGLNKSKEYFTDWECLDYLFNYTITFQLHNYQTLADAAQWECPDCSNPSAVGKPSTGCGGGGLVEKIRAIECDESMTDKEKAKRRQELLSGGVTEAHEEDKEKMKKNNGAVLDILGDKFNCSICMNLLDRPVSVRITDYSLSLCFCVFVFSLHLRK